MSLNTNLGHFPVYDLLGIIIRKLRLIEFGFAIIRKYLAMFTSQNCYCGYKWDPGKTWVLISAKNQNYAMSGRVFLRNDFSYCYHTS